MTDKNKLNKIGLIVKAFCDACKEYEYEKSKSYINCLYCNYGQILKIIESEE